MAYNSYKLTMIHFFWNCRGLGSDTVVRALHGQIRKLRPSMIFRSEMKINDRRINGVKRRMGYRRGFNLPPIGKAGGLSLWWDDSVKVEIIFSSKHVIDARVREVGELMWVRVTRIYGTSYRRENAKFWG